ncbi:recombinase [Taibaiella lutea]|uniref:Recombinase n=1 Tax=Taibaiella lutea TaxID=2608001 RepID=A0A5M6CCA7_9BACT|nr:recombinase RecT [Taibaiella lutea]KAA5532691.1 recombinase [Taibaiella lutea]
MSADNNNQQLQKSSIDKLKSVLSAESVTVQFKNALKEHSDMFIASVIDLYGSDSSLQQCDAGAVVKECLKAAVLKLPINKSLGFAYVIGFNNTKGKDAEGKWIKVMEPTFQLGYKGYIQLAMRTGQYKIINADLVYEGEFKTKNKLTGEFDLTGEKKSETVIGYFAHIEMLNGFSKTLYMTKDKVDAHAKRYSKSYNSTSSPWKSNFDEMATKTVLRNLLSHYGFLSVEMAGAMNQDIDNDAAVESVKNDINDNANSGTMSFDDAEEIKDGEGSDPCPI